MINRNGHFSRPPSLRWRSPQHSNADRGGGTGSTAICPHHDKCDQKKIHEQTCIQEVQGWDDLRGRGAFHDGGTAGCSSRAMDLLRPRRGARMYASDRSPESGSSLDQTSTTKAELTAKNRPAWMYDVAWRQGEGGNARRPR